MRQDTDGYVPARGAAARQEADDARRCADAELSTWLLRGGLAFVFAYAALSMFLDAGSLTSYFPSIAPPWMVARVVLPAFGAYELVLAAGLLSRRYASVASLLAMLTLGAITLLNIDAFGVLFRNVAITAAAGALWLQTRWL